MSRVIVIVAYRPKPGKKSELLELVRSRAPIMMCARRDDHRRFVMEVPGSNRRRAQESERARGVE